MSALNIQTIRNGQEILDGLGERLSSEEMRVLCRINQIAWNVEHADESDDDDDDFINDEDEEESEELDGDRPNNTTVNVMVRPVRAADNRELMVAWASVFIQFVILVRILMP